MTEHSSSQYDLTPEEVTVIRQASAVLNGWYRNRVVPTTHALLSECKEGKISADDALAALNTDCKMLHKIREDVEKNPLLTGEHIGDLIAIFHNFGSDVQHFRAGQLERAVKVLDRGNIPEMDIDGIYHAVDGRPPYIQGSVFKQLARLVSNKSGVSIDELLPQRISATNIDR